MIKVQDVFTAFIPFPDISSELAVRSHMYVCESPGLEKELLKIQSYKPYHIANMPCEKYVDLDAGDDDNPCRLDSFVDLDKTFELYDVRIPKRKLADRNIGNKTYKEIKKELPTVQQIKLDSYDFLDLNYDCVHYI